MLNHPLNRGIPLALVGASDAARRAYAAAEQAAARRTPLLLSCEPGCRPREIAEFVHARSGVDAPFVALDCMGVHAADVERALFGDASTRPMPADLEVLGRDALLLAAGAGTLFVDGLEELPAGAQRRLARVLRDGEARTVSRHDAVAVGCRVIGSASPDLATDVRHGRFRQDLYRRLSASRIAVPPLRQRPEDLPAIIEALLPSLPDGRPRTFTRPAMTVLSALHWAENIDELAELLPRILGQAGTEVRQEDVLGQLPIDGAFTRPDLTASLREARHRFERAYIVAVLERHQWRMVDAARALGIERANLYRKTRQLGITRGKNRIATLEVSDTLSRKR
jgi:DNA-binding NtrC family response regulator